MWRTPDPKMAVRADVCCCGGNCFEKKMAVTENDVVSVLPHVTISDEGFGEASAVQACDVVCGLIVCLNVV